MNSARSPPPSHSGVTAAAIGAMPLAEVFYGMTAKGGTQGVGRGTTQAVVVSSVLIVVIDFFLTRVLSVLLGYR